MWSAPEENRFVSLSALDVWMQGAKVLSEPDGRPLCLRPVGDPSQLVFEALPAGRVPDDAVHLDIANPWHYVAYSDDAPLEGRLDQSAQTLLARGFDGMRMSDSSWQCFRPEQVLGVDHAEELATQPAPPGNETFTPRQQVVLSVLHRRIDEACDAGDDAFFAAVSAKDDYLERIGHPEDGLQCAAARASRPALDAESAAPSP